MSATETSLYLLISIKLSEQLYFQVCHFGAAPGSQNHRNLNAHAQHLDDPLANQILKLAIKGHAEDQSNAAHGFFEGCNGFPQAYEKAVYWAKLAANQGNSEGQYLYAQCLHEGVGITRDVMEADSWWFVAAQAGSSEAQYMLGQSLSLTRSEQYKWLLLASESTNEHTAKLAHKYLEASKPYLSDSEINSAINAVSMWKSLSKRFSKQLETQ